MELLKDKVVAVTGGTRGIGRAVVEALLAEGSRVGLCGRNAEAVQRAAETLQPADRVFAMQADVSKQNEVRRFVTGLSQHLGTIDVLVNCAGVGAFAPTAEISPELWTALIGTNLTGVFYCCREVLPMFQSCGRGDIVNVSSLAGTNAFAGGAGYNASKFGLNGLTEAMMQDYRNEGIRVSLVSPGSVDTEFGGRMAQGAEAEFGGRIAPGDVADAIVGILRMPRRTTISRVELRPSRPPKR